MPDCPQKTNIEFIPQVLGVNGMDTIAGCINNGFDRFKSVVSVDYEKFLKKSLQKHYQLHPEQRKEDIRRALTEKRALEYIGAGNEQKEAQMNIEAQVEVEMEAARQAEEDQIKADVEVAKTFSGDLLRAFLIHEKVDEPQVIGEKVVTAIMAEYIVALFSIQDLAKFLLDNKIKTRSDAVKISAIKDVDDEKLTAMLNNADETDEE